MLLSRQRELSDLRAVVLRLRELDWRVECVLGHSKGKQVQTLIMMPSPSAASSFGLPIADVTPSEPSLLVTDVLDTFATR